MPRIKEVIHCTREPKIVNTAIYLAPTVDDGSNGLESFRDAWFKRGQVLELLVRDAITSYSIVWDPEVGQTTIPEDELIELMHAATFPDYAHSGNLSGHVVRMVFDPVYLAAQSVGFGAVIAALREGLGDGVTTACVYSDPDSLKPVFRVRARYARRPVDMDADDEGHAYFRQTEQSMLRRFYQQHLEGFRLSGLSGVRNVFIREDEREGGLFLDTDCRNMQQAMALKGAAYDRVECNHPLEVYRTLGVEAARQSIIIEIRKVYRYYGINVGARHLTMIADAMTAAGGMMSIDRHGINHAEFNTLKKAAFEEIADVLTKAAVSATCDPLCDNTSRIMIGQEVRVGTGTFDLFLDRERHEQLARTHLQSHRDRKRVQRRKRAIDARMRALDGAMGEYGQPPFSSGYGTSPNYQTHTLVNPNLGGMTQHSVPLDPMAITAFSGSGFGFGGDDEGYDLSNPFGLGADEVEYDLGIMYDPEMGDGGGAQYDPTSPNYEPGIRIERRYSPSTSGWESPTYGPSSPVSPSSPAYGDYDPENPSGNGRAEEYDPEAPAYDPSGNGRAEEYDPTSELGGFFGGGDGEDEDEYNPGW